MPTDKASAVITAAEARALFSGLDECSALLLAVSGGPDSTALMVLAVRWRQSLTGKPHLIVATVDHGLRPESKREAADVATLAAQLGLTHRTLRWTGAKPNTGLQQAARLARYSLLAAAARKAGASHILTAHTRDDQAETVLIRMSRGSGLSGLAAMARESRPPGDGMDGLTLVRPLLTVPKSRLIATLRAAKIPFAEDPSNRDPRFTRARLRGLMPQLAGEGLDARRLSLLAGRLKRADTSIDAAVDRAHAELAATLGEAGTYDAAGFGRLPDEIGLRLLGRAVAAVGSEGPVELAKLEALKLALDTAQIAGIARFRRSLAGAVVTLAKGEISVERAPARKAGGGVTSLTTPRDGRPGASAKPRKSR